MLSNHTPRYTLFQQKGWILADKGITKLEAEIVNLLLLPAERGAYKHNTN